MRRKLLVAVLAPVTLLARLALGEVPPMPSGAAPRFRPVIFVHGFVGSGGQFQTQAMRFASNDYPSTRRREGVRLAVRVHHPRFRRVGRPRRQDRRPPGQVPRRPGRPGRPLAGHVGVPGLPRSSPERAARVAHYANLDGAPAAGPPAGIPTVAVWAEGNQGGSIPGATNVYLPDQSHVQVASSAETFAAMYELFNGRAPRTTGIVHSTGCAGRAGPDLPGEHRAERRHPPDLGGRWSDRSPSRPSTAGALPLRADGSWGPVRANSWKNYEFALCRGATRTTSTCSGSCAATTRSTC